LAVDENYQGQGIGRELIENNARGGQRGINADPTLCAKSTKLLPARRHAATRFLLDSKRVNPRDRGMAILADHYPHLESSDSSPNQLATRVTLPFWEGRSLSSGEGVRTSLDVHLHVFASPLKGSKNAFRSRACLLARVRTGLNT
jgi:hypothetical protein